MNSVQSQKRYDQVCIISRYQNYNWSSVIVKSCPDRSQKCIFSYSENESTPAVLFPRRWDNPPLLWQSAPTFRKTVQIQELCLSQELAPIPIAEVAWIWVVQEEEGELRSKPRNTLPITQQRKVGREQTLRLRILPEAWRNDEREAEDRAGDMYRKCSVGELYSNKELGIKSKRMNNTWYRRMMWNFLYSWGTSLLRFQWVFEERKNYTSNLWQVNPDSIGTFFILEKVLRIRECWRHPWVRNDSKSSPSFFVQKSLIHLCSLIDTRWAQNFDCLKWRYMRGDKKAYYNALEWKEKVDFRNRWGSIY